MSTTIDQIAEFLDEQELSYGRHETDDAILLGLPIAPGITSYRDRAGAACFAFLIRLDEDGEFLSVSLPWTWCLADCPHKPAVFQALLNFQARKKLVRFDYDPDGGELRANAEIGIEDSLLTAAQFDRLVRAVGSAVLELDPVIRHAMRTGEVDMDWLAESENRREDAARLYDLAAQAGGLEAFERLACGEPLAADSADADELGGDCAAPTT